MGDGIWGLVGGGVGAAIGTLAAIWATIRSVRGCRTPAARQFMVRLSVAMWVGLAVFAAIITLHVLDRVPDWAYWAAMAVGIGAIWPLNRLVTIKMATLDPLDGARDEPA